MNSNKVQKNNKYLDLSTKKNKNASRRVSWNIKKIASLTERSSSHKAEAQKIEDTRRNRVVLSVKKLIA